MQLHQQYSGNYNHLDIILLNVLLKCLCFCSKMSFNYMTSPSEESMPKTSSIILESVTDENEENSIPDDPMSDPLALDDILSNTDTNLTGEENSLTEIDAAIHHPEIILVDVTSLTKGN